MFLVAGFACYSGLASGEPIRGGIDVGWGIELNENEIYGAVVANSYKLESEVAKAPRVVIGPNVVKYLEVYKNDHENHFRELTPFNQYCATACLNMVAIDEDGIYFIDYLGSEFLTGIPDVDNNYLKNKASEFIQAQINQHSSTKNEKLVLRYEWLKRYFQDRTTNSA